MVPDSIGHLVTLGLKEDEAETYLHLLSSGPAAPGTLATNAARDVGDVLRCLAVLTEHGLAGPAEGDETSFVALRPELALAALVRRREAELARARIAVAHAFDQRRRSPGTDRAGQFIEVIGGPAAADRVRQLERSARTEVRGLDSPPYYADADANEVELDNLARGVRYRAVYGRAALERPEYLAENVVPCGKAGEQARILPDVPVKLLLVDDEYAVVSPANDADRPVLLIRPCGLLDALIGLFDMCWRAALPLGFAADVPGSSVRPSERRLLGLLAAGLTDDQAARAMGVSRRTLFRYLENLMERTGSANRFQLALHAIRNAWIHAPVQPGADPAPSLRA
ncbi:helix-turn-helix domain-containing protein [Amycolatopsis sp. NPDC059027]|uniref:helix-turn-helix domain-containing protein n=1 Tax=unclassified Amycolatopsis TaxID=2618356 RepID=UPI00367287E2